MSDFPEALPVNWPVGPRYPDWVQAEGPRAWVLYKLKSGTWHIDLLESLGRVSGFDRFVGVEMAMDGALSALCGAFDAAVGGLSLASELHDHLTPSQRTPQHKYNWNILRAKLAALESTESKVQAAELTRRVDDALRRDPDSGYGWLTELRDLRNRAVHRDTLARHIFVTVGEPGSDTYDDWRISVGQAARPEHPVAYLRESQHKLTDLLAPMLNLMDTLWPDGGSGPAGQQSVTIQL